MEMDIQTSHLISWIFKIGTYHIPKNVNLYVIKSDL